MGNAEPSWPKAGMERGLPATFSFESNLNGGPDLNRYLVVEARLCENHQIGRTSTPQPEKMDNVPRAEGWVATENDTRLSVLRLDCLRFERRKGFQPAPALQSSMDKGFFRQVNSVMLGSRQPLSHDVAVGQ